MNPVLNQTLNACEHARRQRKEELLNSVNSTYIKEKLLKVSSIALTIIFSPLLVVLGSIIRTGKDIIFPNNYRIQWFKAKNPVVYTYTAYSILNHPACISAAKARLLLVGTLPYQLIKNGYVTGKLIYQSITK